jgi:hypothetical protein
MYFSKSTGGFYDSDIHSATQIPSDAVQITVEVWQEMIQGQGAGNIISSDSNGNPILVAPPAPTLVQAQTAALANIDEAAESLRSLYITSTPGQIATYMLKYNEASSFAAANYTGTVPALVQSEMTATGATAQAATTAIIDQYNAWASLAAAIETTRRTGKVAVQAATTVDAVNTAVTTATSGFASIKTANPVPSV